MILSEIIKIFEKWTPRWSACENDNPGIQVGDPEKKISTILIALDITDNILDEAIKSKADLIITHHPLFFKPLKNLIASDPLGKIILTLAKNDIALFSAHTNLDFTSGGVSFSLAESLGLSQIQFLKPLSNTLAKVVVFVPESHIENVSNAMTQAGAGIIGNYSSCSFRSNGIGAFWGSSEANPYAGQTNRLEYTNEVRLEMIVPRARQQEIVSAIKKSHPYEEPAYDIYKLENENVNFGMGAIGNLQKPLPSLQFLNHVKKSLRIKNIKYCEGAASKISRVAVCGGAGADLLDEVLSSNADAFITADIKYHTFHRALGRTFLIDAGHCETEQTVLPKIAQRLEKVFKIENKKIKIIISKSSTNPIQYI